MFSLLSSPYCAPAGAADTSFTPLFRLLDNFDSYSREAQSTPRTQTPSRNHPKARRSVAPRSSSSNPFKPKFDVRETETTYELHGELPGLERENVQIEFTEPQTIVISGRVERTYETKPTTEATPEVAEQKTETHSSHHATVEDDPEDFENISTTSSTGRATPTETPKTEVAKPATPAPEVQKAPAEKYWLWERSVGEFSRTFSFPSRVDQDAVTASLDNGVLSVTVPKAKKHETRRIAIN